MLINFDALAQVVQQQSLLPLVAIQTAISEATQCGLSLLHYLIREKILSSDVIAQACATYFERPLLDLRKTPIETDMQAFMQHPAFLRYTYLPIKKNNHALVIAISDPTHLTLAAEFVFQWQLSVEMVFASDKQLMIYLNQAVSQYVYRATPEITMIDLSHQLLTDAIYRNASDIHCETMEKSCRIRMRMDGILHEITQFPLALAASLTSRFKIMAELDIAEKRLPQDGRFSFTTLSGMQRDCRISSCPTLFGEKIVIRLLNPNKNLLNINELGFSPAQKEIFINTIRSPQGLILVTGPTGSGKTITLYTALRLMNDLEKNIASIEDPVEIHLPGINQVSINLKAGLNFATALRAFLRQDPDIIMVGEIRDLETATMAIRAAHTGHLVLSTLHTNSAAEALTRLVNMGIEPFNIASTVILIMAQRLVRLRCCHCDASGCACCVRGYQGRTGVFEMMPINNALRELITINAAPMTISCTAQTQGFDNLWQAGLNKVATGLTDLSEIYRVLQSPH